MSDFTPETRRINTIRNIRRLLAQDDQFLDFGFTNSIKPVMLVGLLTNADGTQEFVPLKSDSSGILSVTGFVDQRVVGLDVYSIVDAVSADVEGGNLDSEFLGDRVDVLVETNAVKIRFKKLSGDLVDQKILVPGYYSFDLKMQFFTVQSRNPGSPSTVQVTNYKYV